MSALDLDAVGLTTTVPPTGRLHQLWCRTCGTLLSVAQPVGFTGWRYPHPAHYGHSLDHVAPTGSTDPAPAPEFAAPPEARKKRKQIPCGTSNGYHAHRRHGEEPCAACRAAHTREAIARKQARRAHGEARYRCGTCDELHDTLRQLSVHVWTDHTRTTTAAERLPVRVHEASAS